MTSGWPVGYLTAGAQAPWVTGDTVELTVEDGDDRTVIETRRGRTLRDVLLEHGHSPYTAVTDRLNCGGRGLCATCGVRLEEPVSPDHLHDRLADRFGYPRLSCQITIETDLTVRIPEKLVWGGREEGHRRP